MGHPRERALRLLQKRRASRFDAVIAFALPPALLRRITESRGHEIAALEPIERGVNGTGRDGASRALFDYRANLDAVDLILGLKKCQEQNLLELA